MSGTAAGLSRVETHASHLSHKGFRVPDPFAPRERPGASFLNALLATALFRCWNIILFYTAWAAAVTVLNAKGYDISFDPTLLTVIGTVLGFVISYRTTSSFERYNEGRRLWSQLILATRTFARLTWFHVPVLAATEDISADQTIARSMIEKKTVINLLEAYAVSIKHYLRGEDGIYYKDLYHLVKFLPAYALPPGMPSMNDISQLSDSNTAIRSGETSPSSPEDHSSFLYRRTYSASAPDMSLPMPVTSPSILVSPSSKKTVTTAKTTFAEPRPPSHANGLSGDKFTDEKDRKKYNFMYNLIHSREKVILPRSDEMHLLPAHMPPKYHLLDLFPLSLVVRWLTKKGKELKGKKAARLRAKMKQNAISHNIPLEISFYLSSYIAALQNRKQIDVPTTNTYMLTLNQLVESLTGFERILTTPIPFSYSTHLWLVTIVYCFTLPLQVWKSLGWLTIPATGIASFIFFGFLAAGEEIENPFGYDKNDLNLDHFTHNIIRNELRAITSAPPPDPSRWAFSPENDMLFTHDVNGERLTPQEWMEKGYAEMQMSLSKDV